MTHLFLFTIGPVQSFIAQARKVQDLAAGSQMLSDFFLLGQGKVDKVFHKFLASTQILEELTALCESFLVPHIQAEILEGIS